MAITGLGMATSVAIGAIAGCAAARAGMSRPSDLDLMAVDSEGDSQPLKGHCLRGITDGFVGAARLLRLVQPAMEDFLASVDQAYLDAGKGGTALFVHVADHYYEAAAGVLDPTVPLGQLMGAAPDDVREEWDLASARLHKVVLQPVAQRLGVASERASLSRGGVAVLVDTLARASALLNEGVVQRCIVISADSLVDPKTLLHLSELGLLKSPDAPVGLAPGEAAIVVALEPPTVAGALGMLSGFGSAMAAEHRFSVSQPTGRALNESMRAAVKALGRPPDVGVVVASLNGDEYRANELGAAIVGLKAEGWVDDAAQMWCPAISFGDTGVTSALLAMVMGVRAFARGYAPARDVVILGISEDGGRGAVIVSRL